MAFPLHGEDSARPTPPTPLPDPYWVGFSPTCAELLGIPLSTAGLPIDQRWLDLLAGNSLETESYRFDSPLATAYSGHQFGIWAGQLGDGRAILLGDVADQELQLKGSGKTIYSRMGDGRAVLRSSIREFLGSEAMHYLGIPTSRALSVVGSKQSVIRETVETAAVCARVAPSFIRIGHFEHHASTQNIHHLQNLAHYLIGHHFADINNSEAPYLDLFKAIAIKNAQLVAQWQSVGFCHGVLNTDNISVLGLTIDYGPFGFLDEFRINHICNHSDHAGRYAYHRQPQIMHWNMACLASAMLPLLELTHSTADAQAMLTKALEEFPLTYAHTWQSLFRKKLGLQMQIEGDIVLIERLLQLLHDSQVDYTSFFRALGKIKRADLATNIKLCQLFSNTSEIEQWFEDYLERLRKEISSDEARLKLMNQVNPKYILRNYLAQKAIELAQKDDFSEVQKLQMILSKPFEEQPEYEAYASPPPKHLEAVEVSCSS